MEEGTNHVHRAVNELLSFVQHRRYEPGEKLPSERELTERFSVGRGVIREALALLEATRYIERRRNSGIYLSRDSDTVSLESLVLNEAIGIPQDQDVLLQSVEVRRILEVQAIALACARRTVEDLRVLEGALERSRASIDQSQSIAVQDYEFHMAIFRSTHNAVLVRMVTPFYLMSRGRRETFFSDLRNGVESHRQHVALVEAIRERDAERASQLMENHIGRVEKHFLNQLDKNENA